MITQPEVIRAFLASIGEPTGPPEPEPLRAVDPDETYFFDAA